MKLKKKSGFSIIEVMIAIAVFSVGILAVLQLIVKNIAVVDTAKQKTFATFLAKEGIELSYNLRDANLEKYLPRDCVMFPEIYELQATDFEDRDTVCEYNFASGAKEENGKYLQLGFNPDGYLFTKRQDPGEDFFDDFENNKLYYHEQTINDIQLSRYNNQKPEIESQSDEDLDLEKTFFARYLVFKPVIENGEELPLDKILKVESHVLIFKGAYTGEIVLESFIGNY